MTHPARPSRGAAVLAALGGLVAALAAGHLVAAFVGPSASPYLAVGNAAIDLSPSWLKDFAVSAFGTADKLVLLLGMAVVLLAVAVLAGVLSTRTPLVGGAVIAAFGVLGGVAVFTRPDVGQLALLAPFASLLAGVAAFNWLYRRAAEDSFGTAPGDADEPGRRRVLVGAGGVVAGAGVAALAGQLIGRSRDAAGSRAAVPELRVADPAPALPADADLAKLGTPTFLTRNADFYRIDTALVVPQVPAEDWSLRIHGMVEREVTFRYDDIVSRPLVERTITLCCVSNEVGGPYISTSNFLGVHLADLLAEAGVQDGAEQLYSTSTDGWTCGTPVSAALDRERGALLAVGMNGEPLPVEHGFPARLVFPGLYGYVSATKWVTDLELTTWDGRAAYWLERGWGREGPVKTQSRIDVPRAYSSVPADGQVVVAGIAWAQFTGIAKVEVRLDDGPWREAELAADVNDDTWRMWHARLDVGSGEHRVTCRATDKSGYTQTSARAAVVPDGATGWHSVTFTATA